MNLGRFLRTVRHLRPVQVTHRIRFRLVRPVTDRSPAPPLRPASPHWTPPARRAPTLIAPTGFRFLNESADLAQIGWDDPSRDKLWRYNQHYFDDLNAEAASERADWHLALIHDWIRENPPGSGTGWEPYPVSLRIVNWVKWARAGNALPEAARHSLAVQARWLMRRLEWHLLGNHLFANAKALVFAGLYFQGPEAERWRSRGFSILARQVPEQILADGGQFERSPMYHALALEDLLDLINLTACHTDALTPEQAAQRNDWLDHVPRMLDWLRAMSHPDGRIAFFNDAAFGVAPENGELTAYAHRLGLQGMATSRPVMHLAQSGYARLDNGVAALLVDLAPIGPDYLPGHAHADTLSLELSVHGQRVLVNSGTSVYGTGTERLRQRGTAAHNTVLVAGRDSSEVWSGFRVGRRARPLDVKVTEHQGTLIAEGAHDGYRYLPGRPLHRRHCQLQPGSLSIRDQVTPDTGEDAEARYHLHPDVRIEQQDPDRGIFLLAGGARLSWDCDGVNARIEPATWHPEFGLSLPNQCLVVPLRGGKATLNLYWS